MSLPYIKQPTFATFFFIFFFPFPFPVFLLYSLLTILSSACYSPAIKRPGCPSFILACLSKYYLLSCVSNLPPSASNGSFNHYIPMILHSSCNGGLLSVYFVSRLFEISQRLKTHVTIPCILFAPALSLICSFPA